MMSLFRLAPALLLAVALAIVSSCAASRRTKWSGDNFDNLSLNSSTQRRDDYEGSQIACGKYDELSDMMVELLFKWVDRRRATTDEDKDNNDDPDDEYNSGVMGVIINENQFITTSDYIERLDKMHGYENYNWEMTVRSHRGRHQVDRWSPAESINKGGLKYLVYTVVTPFTPWSMGGVNRICYDQHLATTFHPKWYTKFQPETAILVTSQQGRRPVDIIKCPCIFPDMRYICVRKSALTEGLDRYEGAMLTLDRHKGGAAYLLALYTPSWAVGCRHDVVRFGRILRLDQSRRRRRPW